MRLNAYEQEFLYQFLGRIDITLIPEKHFLTATLLHERLAKALAGEEKEGA